MANELNIQLDPATYSGSEMVATIKSSAGEIITADIAMSEVDETGFFTGNSGVLDAAVYLICFYIDEALIGVGELLWDGEKEITLLDVASGAGITRVVVDKLKASISKPKLVAKIKKQ